MPFEVKACSIEDMHRHPVLQDRSLARVNVTLRETRAPETFDHDLMLKVWAYTDNDMTPADVKTALLTKAAAILKRTASLAEIQMDGDGLKRLVRAAIKEGHMDQINAEIKAEFGGGE